MESHFSEHTEIHAVAPMQYLERSNELSPWWLSALASGERVDGHTSRVPWLEASALFLPRRLIEHVGFFDERFFLYYEDKEYCRRMSSLGACCLITDCASYSHAGGGSFDDPGSLQRQLAQDRGLLLYCATEPERGFLSKRLNTARVCVKRMAQHAGRRG